MRVQILLNYPTWGNLMNMYNRGVDSFLNQRVWIWLTDLPNSGERSGPPGPLFMYTSVQCKYSALNTKNETLLVAFLIYKIESQSYTSHVL